MSDKRTTGELYNVLKNMSVDDIQSYLGADGTADGERLFSRYMRVTFRAKGLRQQDVFLAADIPERYGYKLISGEKRTRQRDVILRLCLGAGFSLAETQHALKMYGMAELYARMPRDAVLIIAANTGVHDVHAVDELLTLHGLARLAVCGNVE